MTKIADAQAGKTLPVQNTEAMKKPIFDSRKATLVLLRHWKLLAACALAGALLGLGLAAISPKVYTANASGVVIVRVTNDSSGALMGDSVAKSKATQYQSLAKSRTVAADALRIARLDGSPEAAATSIAVAVPLDTPQINISVSRDDPQEAATLANAWVKALAKSVNDLAQEQVGGSGRTTGTPAISLRTYVPALAPQSPSSPNTTFNVLLGTLLGILAGCFWTFVRHKGDRRIRGTEVIEKEYGLSVLGTLPKRPDGERRAFLLDKTGARVSKEDFHSVESFNTMRANLQFMSPDDPPRIIVVTSPLPAEGKSTVASNLALTIAEAGRPVVLVDGDLRRPTLASAFGLLPDVGVTTAIVGHATAHDMLQEVHGSTLQVMTSGPTPPNPSEIIASDAFLRLCQELAKDALVIIDAPPLIPVADAAIMARRFDGCLVVLDAQVATRDAFDKALSVLDKMDADVLGVILNRVPTNKLEGAQYGYYGDYSYYGSAPSQSPVRGATEAPRPQARLSSPTGGGGVGTPGSGAAGATPAGLPSRRQRRAGREERPNDGA